MQIDIRLTNTLDHPVLREAIERRTRSTLTRLSPQLTNLTVSVTTPTLREGGQTACRVSGALHGGGTLHVTGADTRPHRALDAALRRFRHTMRRTLDRRVKPGNHRSRLTAE